MKSSILLIVIAAIFNVAFAQTNSEIAISGMPVEMLFPGGKAKALILSWDDGRAADRRLVQLLNKYALPGTFHLNSNKLGTDDYLTKDEIKTLFKGHEVSVHSANHPNLNTLSKADVVYEVVEDRKELERLTGAPVRGMAYPFGNHNDFVVDAITGLGIEYARTVNDTYNFSIPDDFLKWHPTIHQFGKAYFIANEPEKDKKELVGFYQLITVFLTTEKLALLDVWGHSWENDGAGDRWTEMDKFFKMIAANNSIYYTTQIGLVDYIYAFRNLKFSVTKSVVTNLSAMDVFIKINGKVFTITAGQTISLKY